LANQDKLIELVSKRYTGDASGFLLSEQKTDDAKKDAKKSKKTSKKTKTDNAENK
tara:strand:+ start:337 stop:501 length:165 start_codon:yes stop_codon:yes gene_type:complete